MIRPVPNWVWLFAMAGGYPCCCEPGGSGSGRASSCSECCSNLGTSVRVTIAGFLNNVVCATCANLNADYYFSFQDVRDVTAHDHAGVPTTFLQACYFGKAGAVLPCGFGDWMLFIERPPDCRIHFVNDKPGIPKLWYRSGSIGDGNCCPATLPLYDKDVIPQCGTGGFGTSPPATVSWACL